MPQRWSDRTELPNMMSPHGDGSGWRFRPTQDYVLFTSPEAATRRNIARWFDSGLARPQTCIRRTEDAQSWLFCAAPELWTAVRLMFFPIFGVAGLAALLRLRGTGADGRRESRQFLVVCAGASLVAGFAVAFGFEYNGFKWELTRFLIPGVLLGLICLVILAREVERATPSKAGRALTWTFIVLVGTWGPATDFVAELSSQLASGKPSLGRRLDLLFNARGPFR